MIKYFILVLLLFSHSTYAQNPQPKAKELYEKAEKKIAENKLGEAIKDLLNVVKKDTLFPIPYFKLGQIYEIIRSEKNALKFYKKALELSPNDPLFTQGHIYTGIRLMKAGDYSEAEKYLNFSIKNVPKNSPIMKQLTRQIEQCEFGKVAKNEGLSIKAKEMGPIINSKNKQYFPVLTIDGRTLIFTARSENGDENLYTSQFTNGNWTMPKSISDKINTNANEGTCSISADGRTLVFTSCDREHGFGSCDLYISKKIGEEWTKPENLGNSINTPFWEAQPSLSNDGRVLYFSSNRQGGFGRKDLWVSKLTENNSWTKATNLGGIINTSNDEVSPFIHANRNTLFFASDGHLGMGGLDLFKIETKNDTYLKPENLGFPINTHEDQVSLFISADGSKAYYSSDIKSDTKLFQFDVPRQFSDKFKQAFFVKGVVKDTTNNQNISAAIELVDLKTNSVIEKIVSDSISGEYTTVLPSSGEYGLFINKNNYFFKSLHFNFSEKDEIKEKNINILLQPIKKDTKTVLNNIFFDVGKVELRPESFIELNKIQAILANNPTLQVEISGHSDDVGKETDNQILSEKRALSVANYLIKKGINTENIKVKGFGKGRPLVPNTSEKNRQTNRRIEMSIL